MDAADIDLLAACFEARRRQREMLPLIASALGISEKDVFYTWALARECRQTDEIPGSSWRVRFHGFECDVMNSVDGRFLRYDFGPSGTVECVTAWGILQFIMTAVAPWQEFPALREQFARTGPPYDYLSGDHNKIHMAWERLEAAGCFAPADSRLVAFQEAHTTIGPDGINDLAFPDGTSDEMALDCLVAARQVLTARANELLAARRPMCSS